MSLGQKFFAARGVNLRDLVCQGNGLGYWTEGLANRNGLRFRGHFQGLRYEGH